MFFKKRTPPQPSAEAEPQPKKKANWLKISMAVNGLILALMVIGLGTTYVVHQSDTNPQFCGLCHVMQKNVQSYTTGHTLDNVHQQAGVQCKQCHDYPLSAEITSGVKFMIGDYDVVNADNPSLPKRSYSDEMCLKCHISTSHVAAATDFLARNPHQSHWTDLHCSTCHTSHGEQVDYCGKCHDNGNQRMVGAAIISRANNPWVAGKGSKDAPTATK